MLAGLLQHGLCIGIGTHHPHHHVVAGGRLVEQQGGIEAQPAVHRFLLGIHRHRHQIHLRPAAGGDLLRAAVEGGGLADLAILALQQGGDRHQHARISQIGAHGCGSCGAAATATPAAATRSRFNRSTGCEHLSAGGGGGTHQAGGGGQRLEAVLPRQHGHVAQAATAGAGATEQLVDVLALALAGEFHQAQFRELGDLGTGRVIADGLGEVLQQLQLVAAGLHVDEVDDHHASDVAQLELAGDLHRRLTVGPEHRLARVGGAGEGARVHVDHRERLGGLDDHVPPGGQIDPRLESIADGGVDLERLQDVGGFAVGLHLHIGVVGTQKGIGPGDGRWGIHHHPQHIGVVEIAQHAMDEVLIAVEQHGWAGRLGGVLDRFPLAQQGFQIVNQQVFVHPLRLGADQQSGTGRLDQHPKRTQAVALMVAVDPAGDVHALAMGLEHQEAAGQGEIAGEPGPLGARGLLHHLHQHLLPGLQQLGDAGSSLLQAQRTKISDMNEAVLFTLTDIDKSRINAGEHIFNSAQIHIADLVAALGNNQLVNTLIVENRGDPQLLGNDDLLWHGGRGVACSGRSGE